MLIIRTNNWTDPLKTIFARKLQIIFLWRQQPSRSELWRYKTHFWLLLRKKLNNLLSYEDWKSQRYFLFFCSRGSYFVVITQHELVHLDTKHRNLCLEWRATILIWLLTLITTCHSLHQSQLSIHITQTSLNQSHPAIPDSGAGAGLSLVGVRSCCVLIGRGGLLVAVIGWWLKCW